MNATVIACRNCDAALAAEQTFCGACGQRASVDHRLKMRDIGHDLIHAIAHVDHSIFALVRALVIRPGQVARDYVEGKRKRYFGPFAFLFIMVGLASAIILITGVKWFKPINAPAQAQFLETHINLVILLQVPILAGISALAFFRERLHYAEHLVFAAYTSGFRVALLGLVVTPLLYLLEVDTATTWIASPYFLIWFAYFAFGATQFYRGNRIWIALKAVFVAALSQAVAVYLVFLYIYTFAMLKDH